MKKVVRTVWIGLLTGLAFLVACTSNKGLTRAEKKQLKAERTAIIAQIDQQRQESMTVQDPGIMLSYRDSELGLRKRLSEINSRLGDHDAQMENGEQMGIILTEMDSLQGVIDAHKQVPLLYGPPVIDPTSQQQIKEQQRSELQEQLNQLMQAIQRRESSCIYGSPEVMELYAKETQRMYQESNRIRQQLKELDDNGSETGEE